MATLLNLAKKATEETDHAEKYFLDKTMRGSTDHLDAIAPLCKLGQKQECIDTLNHAKGIDDAVSSMAQTDETKQKYIEKGQRLERMRNSIERQESDVKAK